jgi:hypothetical protein
LSPAECREHRRSGRPAHRLNEKTSNRRSDGTGDASSAIVVSVSWVPCVEEWPGPIIAAMNVVAFAKNLSL